MAERLISGTFKCPACGSVEYGTSCVGFKFENWTPEAEKFWNENAEGLCHGYDKTGRPCGFRWKRKDDTRYFR